MGDNLQFSNLPRLYHSIDIKFYISRLNYSRNLEIHKLVWSNNIFVKKNKKLFPNVGYKVLLDSNFKLVDEKYNNIQNINTLHGFEPGLGFPEFSLKKNDTNTNLNRYDVVLDFNAFSLFQKGSHFYDLDQFNTTVDFFSSKNTTELSYPNLYKSPPLREKHKKVEIHNLSDLINVLLRTKTFVCLNSGSHILASGLKEMTGSPKKIISFNSFYDDIEINNGKILKKLGKFYFDNVNYFYIDTGLNNKIYKKDLNFLDLQNIESKMDKYTKLNQIYFHYLKKFTK